MIREGVLLTFSTIHDIMIIQTKLEVKIKICHSYVKYFDQKLLFSQLTP